jgi:hypothetical protein
MAGKRKHHIGRLRMRAAEILNAYFPAWEVRPEDIRPATGRWRSDVRCDVYRWELYARHRQFNYPIVVGCWETLTLFCRLAAKYGCHEEAGVIYSGPPLTDK